LGPMMDLNLYLLYTRVFRPRLIWTIIPTVFIQVFILTNLVHYIWPELPEKVRFLVYYLSK
jgi:hypothetical protein